LEQAEVFCGELFLPKYGTGPAGHCPMAGEITGIEGESMDELLEVLEKIQMD